MPGAYRCVPPRFCLTLHLSERPSHLQFCQRTLCFRSSYFSQVGHSVQNPLPYLLHLDYYLSSFKYHLGQYLLQKPFLFLDKVSEGPTYQFSTCCVIPKSSAYTIASRSHGDVLEDRDVSFNFLRAIQSWLPSGSSTCVCSLNQMCSNLVCGISSGYYLCGTNLQNVNICIEIICTVLFSQDFGSLRIL